MPSFHAETSPREFRKARVARWLLPAALLALMPKCVLCVLAYVGAGAAFGLSGPEWCRADGDMRSVWITGLAWAGAAGVIGAVATWRRKILGARE